MQNTTQHPKQLSGEVFLLYTSEKDSQNSHWLSTRLGNKISTDMHPELYPWFITAEEVQTQITMEQLRAGPNHGEKIRTYQEMLKQAKT